MANVKVNFLSYTLHRAVDLTVIIPTMCFSEMMQPNPAHAADARYPVLYLLHGYGNNHATWNGYTSVELYAEERNMAVVMLSAENKAYINHDGDDNYYDFISHELPEFIQSMFPVSDRPEDTYIAGLSMGSMGTLLHSLSMPERFRAAGAFSGPMMQMNMGMTPEERAAMTDADWDQLVSPEAVELVEKAKAEGKSLPDYYVATGTQDNPEGSKAFARFLEKNGAKVTTNFERVYGHEWQFWDESIKEFLDWLPRTDAYAGQLRKI